MKTLLAIAVLATISFCSCETEVRDGQHYDHPRGWEHEHHPDHHEVYNHGYHHDSHGAELIIRP